MYTNASALFFSFLLKVSHLSFLGGYSTKEVVDRIMSLMFTTELARKFNWVGKGIKHPMKGLRITTAIKGYNSSFKELKRYCRQIIFTGAL